MVNWPRVLLAGCGGFVAYMVVGGLLFTLPTMRNEFRKYPAVYRSEEGIKQVMPFGMAAMLLSMLALAYLYAGFNPYQPSLAVGIEFGAVIGVFQLGTFVIHNHVNLNIGWRLTVQSALAYFLEWTITGIAIAFLYRPGPHA